MPSPSTTQSCGDPTHSRQTNSVVSRVNLSHRFARELSDALHDALSKWSTREGIKNLP